MWSRRMMDVAAYEERIRTGPCFICRIIARDPNYYDNHHMIYEDETAVVFLNKYPTLYGYVLVAPREHREQVTGDFSPTEYLALQQLIHRVGEAVRQVVPTERLYILSLGSQQGNRHVHWHLAPLPPGVPFAEQQLVALQAEQGYLELPREEMASLAARIRQALLAGESQATEGEAS
ncbi:MAG: HIT family protein [Chloroflexi bacterium]|nr:HIT family protein [Chloroflexota bacterium]MCI0577864.1 HIT family protein [Chloroflexota bacterium]MCI0644500.1 HIT family protein [Chloroflexota bacterium]MCI0730232.1 HIT family protein [Chloroflexota bacterium]